MFEYAGRFGPEAVTDLDGNAQLGVSILVLDSVGAHAVLYTDAIRTSQATNPVVSDLVTGNLTFYADPGEYQLTTPSGLIHITVPMDPRDLPAHTAATDPHGDRSYTDTKVAALINAAPGALDTLKELADALADDPNFATTVTTALAGKLNVVVHGSTAGMVRPTGATEVLWIGTVAPINAVVNDLWWDQTVTLIKLWSGSVWQAAGNTTYPSLDGSSRLAIGGVELTPDQIGGIGPGSPTLTGSPTIRANASGAVTPILNFDAFGRDWQIGIDTSNDGGGRSLFISKFVQRTISDLVTTNTSTAVTSATQARFGPNDNGTAITGAGIPAGTTLVWVRGTDTLTSARLSQPATATASGVTATIGSDPAAVQDLFFFRDNGGNGSALGIGVTPPTGSHRLEVGGSDGDTTQGGIRIRVGPSQTGTALSVYDSGGTEQYSIDSAFYANQVRIRGASGGRLTTLATNDLANSWGWDIDGTQGKGVLALRYLTTAHDALYAGTDGSIRIVTKLIADTVTANAQLTITSPATGTITAVFKRLSGQTKGLVVCRDESNNFLASIDQNGLLNWATANQATGAGSAALGTNCPAVTATAPNTWLKVVLADGSTAYLPAWK